MPSAGDSDRPEARGSEVRGKSGMPRWVKAFAAVGLLLFIVVAIMVLTGHGPAEHLDHALVLVPSASGSA